MQLLQLRPQWLLHFNPGYTFWCRKFHPFVLRNRKQVSVSSRTCSEWASFVLKSSIIYRLPSDSLFFYLLYCWTSKNSPPPISPPIFLFPEKYLNLERSLCRRHICGMNDVISFVVWYAMIEECFDSRRCLVFPPPPPYPI